MAKALHENPQKKHLYYRNRWLFDPDYRQHLLDYARCRYAQKRVLLQQWLEEKGLKLACSKCPEDHPATIDFHHRNPAEKDMAIMTMLQKGCSRRKIEVEIDKCDILCSNCHRKLHDALRKAESGVHPRRRPLTRPGYGSCVEQGSLWVWRA